MVPHPLTRWLRRSRYSTISTHKSASSSTTRMFMPESQRAVLVAGGFRPSLTAKLHSRLSEFNARPKGEVNYFLHPQVNLSVTVLSGPTSEVGFEEVLDRMHASIAELDDGPALVGLILGPNDQVMGLQCLHASQCGRLRHPRGRAQAGHGHFGAD